MRQIEFKLKAFKTSLLPFLTVVIVFTAYGTSIKKEFITRTQGLKELNLNVNDKNGNLFDSILATNNPEIIAKSKVVKNLCSDYYVYLDSLETKLVFEAGGINSNGELVRPYDMEASTKLLGQGNEGIVFYKKKQELKKQLAELSATDSSRDKINTLFTELKVESGKSWNEQTFSGIPVVASITILTKFQNDCLHAESYLLEDFVREGFDASKKNRK